MTQKDTGQPAQPAAAAQLPLSGVSAIGAANLPAGTIAIAGRSIAELNLAEHALNGAQLLLAAHPNVVFTSGRRDTAAQARAMAGNVVVNRDWIKQTYAQSSERDALQGWVDANPKATTVDAISQGLAGVMAGWTDAQKRKISRHLAGLAFDMAPVSGPAGEIIKTTIRALPHLHRFLESEGGIEIWHASFGPA